MSKKFKLITLGCKVNQYESAFLREKLIGGGLQAAAGGAQADITIINTCVVTHSAAAQSRQAIRKAIRENPRSLVAATGCYAQGFPQELSGIKGLNLIWGNADKAGLAERVLGLRENDREILMVKDLKEQKNFEFLPVARFSDRTRAFLKIQDGCRSFCSYCIVPFTRGPLRSLPVYKVHEQVEVLLEEGYREIVLTGIHLGKYGTDLDRKTDLKFLLRSIAGKGIPARIRLTSLEPNEIDNELIELVASGRGLCDHFHIPLQSGDNGILKAMNRHYSAEDFALLVDSINRRIPLAAVGVDVMSGFPGEDQRAHRNTLSLIGDLPVSYLHVFPFSSRAGTAAHSLGKKVDPETVKSRTSELRGLGRAKKMDFYRLCLGVTFETLVEGRHSGTDRLMKGITGNYIPVLFDSHEDLSNRFIKVSIDEVLDEKVKGTRVPDSNPSE